MKTNVTVRYTELTRRQFLRGTALSAAAFMAVPGGVLGLRGAASANQKLNLAGIGIGGQGGQRSRPDGEREHRGAVRRG